MNRITGGQFMDSEKNECYNLLMGIGNILNGDDGVGCYIAKRMRELGWNTLDCSTAPENFSGQVKRYHPNRVIVVDAALMNLPAGSIRRIDSSKIQEVGFSTHTISLSYFMDYISEECRHTILIGIEPQDMTFGNSLSSDVLDSAEKLVEILLHDQIDQIPHL
jgi:hydrogenase 3 maturation protease